jgi:hypothetical protein
MAIQCPLGSTPCSWEGESHYSSFKKCRDAISVDKVEGKNITKVLLT